MKVAFITGGAKRIGACVARTLHRSGYNLIVHYRHSATDAQELADELNAIRSDSVRLLAADLTNVNSIQVLGNDALQQWGHINVLINNASSFYSTPMGKATQENWEQLIGPNMMAPFFLAQTLHESLKAHTGCIINIADIYADRPLQQHSIYCAAKAGLVSLTKSMAYELGPEVRVNAISPGPILWPSNTSQENKNDILQSTALKRLGGPEQIANTIDFLLHGTDYITGQVIAVDGGRTLTNP